MKPQAVSGHDDTSLPVSKARSQISLRISKDGIVKHQPVSNMTTQGGLPARRDFAELHSDSESVFNRIHEPDTRYQGKDKITKGEKL